MLDKNVLDKLIKRCSDDMLNNIFINEIATARFHYYVKAETSCGNERLYTIENINTSITKARKRIKQEHINIKDSVDKIKEYEDQIKYLEACTPLLEEYLEEIKTIRSK